jgi:hypothetical protein
VSIKGLRKFIFALVAIILPSILIAWGKLESGSYTAIMIAVTSGYLAANVASAVGVKIAERPVKMETKA